MTSWGGPWQLTTPSRDPETPPPDSCQAPPYSGFPKLQVACGLVTLLTSLLLLLALWRWGRGLGGVGGARNGAGNKLRLSAGGCDDVTSGSAPRVKHSLLPWVPDPRGGFRGLFERHGGNFQVSPTHFLSVRVPLPVPHPSTSSLTLDQHWFPPLTSGPTPHCRLRPSTTILLLTTPLTPPLQARPQNRPHPRP